MKMILLYHHCDCGALIEWVGIIASIIVAFVISITIFFNHFYLKIIINNKVKRINDEIMQLRAVEKKVNESLVNLKHESIANSNFSIAIAHSIAKQYGFAIKKMQRALRGYLIINNDEMVRRSQYFIREFEKNLSNPTNQ